jgi:hypothetical protein
MGIHEAAWPSERLEVMDDSVGRRYDSVATMRHIESIRAFFERGEDSYGALMTRGRELGIQVLASIRMNDNHFWDLRWRIYRRPGDPG